MTIKAIVFDIGGVLEITPNTGWQQKWEDTLHLPHGQLRERLYDTWRGGSIGTISYEDVQSQITSTLNISPTQVNQMMDDLWTDYLGTLNTELYNYFKSLRARFQTAILSNSFVGAREREQALYGFEDSCDFIVYSHEVGMSKPDPAIYALTCGKLKLEPNEVIFVDDVKSIIEAAEVSGMHGIQFQNNQQTMADIERLVKEQAE